MSAPELQTLLDQLSAYIARARREAFERGWDAALDSLGEQIEIGKERIANEPEVFRDLARQLYFKSLENPLPMQRTVTRVLKLRES